MGYDIYYILYDDLVDFLLFAKKMKIKIHNISYVSDRCLLFIPVTDRLVLRKCPYSLVYIKTIGLFNYFFYLICSFKNFVFVTTFIISLYLLSSLIMSIKFIGLSPSMNQKIHAQLLNESIGIYEPLKTYESLNDILMNLKSDFKNDIEYLNIYQNGSVFYVEYTLRYNHLEEDVNYHNLYAKEDGLIESYNVDSGIIKVKKNDYVYKGDLLIENTFVSTQNETILMPVKGQVFAYTFHEYQAESANVNGDFAQIFYCLLLQIRSKIPTDAYIDKENVLQIEKSSSKIVLKMHYTLIEDITEKGEIDEGSN